MKGKVNHGFTAEFYQKLKRTPIFLKFFKKHKMALCNTKIVEASQEETNESIMELG